MRILGFLTLLGLATSALNAQKVKVSWSEESKVELEYGSLVKGNGTEMVKLCFENKGGGLFSKRTTTPVLSRYNNKLVEQGLKSYTVAEDNIVFNGLVSVQNNLFMFTNQYDKESKSTTFYSQKIDAQTLNPVGKPNTVAVMAAIDRGRQSTGNYELSKDSSRVLFFGLSPYSKKDVEKYYMSVYDAGMTKLWDNTVQLPYLDKFVAISDYMVTNDGSVGIIIKHYDKEVVKEKIKEDGSNVPAYKTKFLLYQKGEAKPKEYVLDMKDKFVQTVQLVGDKNNSLSLFGLYKNKYDGYVTGYFMASLNQGKNNIETSKMEAFSDELVTLIKKDKQGSNKEKDPGLSSNFNLADIVERADGSKDYILEYYQRQEVSHYNGRTWSSYTVYTYGDIIDLHVKDEKTVVTRIPKWQITRNTSIYSGFKAVSTNNKLVLFYNDEKDNVERDLSKKPDDITNFGKSVLAMAVIDQKDNLTRNIVYDHRDMKLTTCVRVSQKLTGDKIGLYAHKNGGLFSSAKDMVGILEVN